MDQIISSLQAIIDGALDDDGIERALNADEVTRYEALEAELATARASAEVVKRNAAYQTVNRPVVFGAVEKTSDYERAFEAYLRTGQVNGDIVSRAQSESVGSAGGFLVPEEWRGLIIEKMVAFGGVAAAAENITTSDGRPLSWLTNDETSSSLAAVTAEAGLWSAGDDLTFSNRTLGAYKYTTVGASNLPLKISYELLQDANFDLKGFVAKKFATRIARKMAVDFVNGTGINEPQGLISTQGGIASGTARAASASPTYAELLATVHALDPAYRDGASWVFNDATLALLRGVVDGSSRPLLWNQNDDLTGALKGMTLLGYPVIIDQAFATTAASGSAKSIFFGNLKDAYIVRSVKAFEMVVLNELYAVNGQVGMMGWLRADGMVQDPNAGIVKPNAA